MGEKTGIKGCPFCGTQPEITPWHGGPPTKRMISCINDPGCDVLPMVSGDTMREAVKRWNTRTVPDQEA